MDRRANPRRLFASLEQELGAIGDVKGRRLQRMLCGYTGIHEWDTITVRVQRRFSLFLTWTTVTYERCNNCGALNDPHGYHHEAL